MATAAVEQKRFDERPVVKREAFEVEFKALKEKHGKGYYSWAEGMTRRIARKIARKKAKQAVAASAA